MWQEFERLISFKQLLLVCDGLKSKRIHFINQKVTECLGVVVDYNCIVVGDALEIQDCVKKE